MCLFGVAGAWMVRLWVGIFVVVYSSDPNNETLRPVSVSLPRRGVTRADRDRELNLYKQYLAFQDIQVLYFLRFFRLRELIMLVLL